MEKTISILTNIYARELREKGFKIESIDLTTGIITATRYRGRGKRRFLETTNFQRIEQRVNN